MGCFGRRVVHPAAFTFKLPDNVTFAEGAMVEPLAVGMHAAVKARVVPGDVAVVSGAGPIGMVTALAALAAGCSRVYVTDVQGAKLEVAESLGSESGPGEQVPRASGAIVPVNVSEASIVDVVKEATDGWGVDIFFECSGNERAAAGVFEPLRPGGCVVYVGMPGGPISYDVVAAPDQGGAGGARVPVCACISAGDCVDGEWED